MKYHRWTRNEIHVLKRNYTLRGAAWIADKLGLNVNQVKNKARNLDIIADTASPGSMLLNEAAFHIAISYQSVYRRAVQDDVMKRIGRQANGKARLLTVPVKWVEAQVTAARRESEVAHRGWLTVVESADALRVPHESVRAALRGEGWLATFGVTLKWETSGGPGPGKIAVDPLTVDALRVALDRRDRFARSLVRAKTLAVEIGYTNQGLRGVLRRMGIEPVVLHVRRGRAAFVSRADAERVRLAFLGLKEAA